MEEIYISGVYYSAITPPYTAEIDKQTVLQKKRQMRQRCDEKNKCMNRVVIFPFLPHYNAALSLSLSATGWVASSGIFL